MVNYWQSGDKYKDLNKKVQFLNAVELSNKIKFNDGAIILDVGCGTGDILVYLASECPKCYFYGMDLSPDMLNVAKTQAESRNLKNIEFLEANVDIIELGEKHYDVIISNAAFHWFNRDVVLNKLAESLNNHGILAIHTAGTESFAEDLLDKEERDFLSFVHKIGFIKNYANYSPFNKRRMTPIELKDSFECNSLSVLEYGLVIRKVYFPNFEEYFTWLQASGNTWFEPLPESQKEFVYQSYYETIRKNIIGEYFVYHASSFCIAKKL